MSREQRISGQDKSIFANSKKVVYCLFLGKQHAIVVASDIPLAERARKFDADASVKNVGDNTV